MINLYFIYFHVIMNFKIKKKNKKKKKKIKKKKKKKKKKEIYIINTTLLPYLNL